MAIKTTRIEIKKIFDLYENTYGIDFKINQVTPIPKGLIIDKKSITHLVKKEKTDIYEVHLNNGEIIYPSINHPFMINNKKVHLKNLKEGDLLSNNVKIIKKKYYAFDYVYDFTVDTKEHTYMKAGVKHHNSLDEIPLNHQFSAINFDTPSKEDFMAYIGSRFAGEEGQESTAKVSPEVFNKFMEVLESVDMGGKDEETDIRVSPRRWEEIIKYVSNGIPPKNQKDAESLVQFVYTNMKNYKEGTQSGRTEKYAQMVRDLINDNSEFNVDGVYAPVPSDWEGLFEQQIKSKMEMGADRKYVVSLAGKPGVGKCLEKDYELEIFIDSDIEKQLEKFYAAR